MRLGRLSYRHQKNIRSNLQLWHFTLIFILVSYSGWSQTYPVQANLFISPPYSVYLSDYTSPGSTRLTMNIFLADLTRPDLDIRFRLLIEGPGIEIRTRQEYIGTRVTLLSGTPTQFYGDELQEYFNLQNLDISGISRTNLERTGALPEGIYRFTLEVLEYNRGVKISNSASNTAWLILNDPPLLNLPLDNEVVKASDPQTVRFQWTPRHKGSPNSSFSTEYSLKIVEIWPENRNPNDAINTSNPIFETTTANNYFIYSLADPALIPGKRYAFQVQAKAQAGIDQMDLFKNNGYSEVRSFVFGESCDPPDEISLESSGNTYLNLNWQPKATNTAFNIKYKEDVQTANWFDDFSYLPSARIEKLKQNTTYQVVIQSLCGTLVSDDSNPVVVTTANNQDQFACGNIDLDLEIENRSPIQKLNAGDVFYAGDFKVKLDSISGSSGKFSGTGMASFPFLNFVKTKVHFEEIQVNTDFKMFNGVVKTVYDPFSSMMYDADKDVEVQDEIVISDSLATQDSTQVDSLATQINQPEANAPIEVDSVYKNAEGEIIVVIDGEETTVEPKEGEDIKFVDSEGNLITVSSSGEITKTPAGGTTTTTADQIANDGTNFTFGPLTVRITEQKEPEQSGETCTYNGLKAAIELNLEDVNLNISKTISLESAIFSYTKDCESGEILSAKIDWQSDEGKDIGSLSEIEAKVYELSLEVDKDGNLTGDVGFYAYLSQDKNLTGLAVLRAGLSGEFSFMFQKTASGFEGKFDFRDIEGLNIDIIKQNKVLASLENGSFDQEGNVNGKVRLIEQVEYQSSQFSILVKKLVFDIEYGLGRAFQIKEGSATLILSDIQMLNGEIKLLVEVLDNTVTTTIAADELTAFGMELTEVNLTIDLDPEFNFTTITGNLQATHPEFGVSLAVSEVEIDNGTLAALSFSGEVRYNGDQVMIQGARLEKESKSIVLDAFAEVEKGGINIAASVKNFRIDIDGNISWDGYEANFDGVRTFGPLKVALSGQKGEDSGKWRVMTASASLSLQLNEESDETITIVDATIDFTKHKNKEEYKDIKITIEEANISVPDIGPLHANLQKLFLEIETDAKSLSGSESDAALARLSSNSYIKFSVGLNEDVNIGSIVYLNSGITGFATYNFNGEGLRGALDFHEVSDINIEARKGNVVLAGLSNGTIDETGLLNGKVTAIEGASFSAGSMTVDVEELNFDVIVPFKGDFSGSMINAGNGRLSINNMGRIEGSLVVDITLAEDNSFTAQVANTSKITAFGMALTDLDLKLEIQPDLQVDKIAGKLKARHEEFDAAFNVGEFLLEAGELKVFDFQSKVVYQGFHLDLQKAEYRNDLLEINGKIAFNISGSESWIEVKELTIDSEGKVTIKGVKGELEKSPVSISFSASMDKSRFKGSFKGDLSGIGLSGAIDIGVEDDTYNFAYLELTASGNIILPGTGLKLTKLGGQLGYNYALVYSQAGKTPTGNPQEGNYVVGLTLGVADLANMFEVTGNSVVQFGTGKFDLNLNGTIKIPKNNSIATGDLNVHYMLPGNTLNGSIGLDVSVPPGTGKLFSGNFAMEYAMGNSEWSVTSTNINAKLLSEIEFVGSIALEGSDDSFSGKLSGSSSYAFAYRDSTTIAGNSVVVSVDAGFNFSGDIAFDDLGAKGKVSLQIYANGELGLVPLIGSYETLIELNGYSDATLVFDNDGALLTGQLNVTVYILGIEYNKDVEIEQLI